jgi:hypothetical protein
MTQVNQSRWVKAPIAIFVFLFAVVSASAQIQVSPNGKFLQTKDGQPFFWVGDTAWELFHRLTREEAIEFLSIRQQQEFNVIQAVALAEFNGIREPNRYGDWPLNNENPAQLAVTPGNNPANPYEYDYWDHVDFVIDEAAKRNLFIGLLPTWGDKLAHMWGDGPIIFNEQNAFIYGATLAKRYQKQWNIIWILGGDRPAVYTWKIDGVEKSFDDRAMWRAMAHGIESVVGKDTFITYHPAGGPNSTSQFMHEEPWLDMNAFQSGHGSRESDAWNWVVRDLAKQPQKPTLDMEPCYEDHPVNPWDGKWTRQRGYFNAYDVRARIYRGIFAGACGVTYGHHQIWQFLNPALYAPVNIGDTTIGWQKAAHAEAATQLVYLKKLMLSKPYFNRISDNSLILSDKGKEYTDLLWATRDEAGTYALIYLPQPKPVRVDLTKIKATRKKAAWFDVRTGQSTPARISGKSAATFTPPKVGQDWVLVIEKE